MKLALLMLLSACPLHAALLAHVTTSRGTVTVELQFGTAPQAVANFMTLAQGKRTRIDPRTGATTDDPLYIGEKFFRTANSASTKFAQTGSGTGSNNGSSGFTFKDEFTPTVRHTGYTLSSANAGPNANGGQIFFTGNVAIPSYDDVHSIIGLVPDPASRAVIDAIIAAGDNATTITGITFDRTDPSAVAFNEMAQNLPTVEQAKGHLQVQPGAGVAWHLDVPLQQGDLFVAKRSLTFSDWASILWDDVDYVHSGPNDPSIDTIPLGDAAAPQAFYHVTLSRHPGSLAPSHFKNRQLNTAAGTAITAYVFDATGTAGVKVLNPGAPNQVAGAFTMSDWSTSAHGGFLLIHSPSFFPPFNIVKFGVDADAGGYLSGRHTTTYFDPSAGSIGESSGPMALTK